MMSDRERLLLSRASIKTITSDSGLPTDEIARLSLSLYTSISSSLSIFLLLFFSVSFSLSLSPSRFWLITDTRRSPTKTAVKLYARDGESGREWPSSRLASHCEPRRRFAERYGTTSRSSDYASRRTSFGADRQSVPMGVDCSSVRSSVRPSSAGFTLRSIYDRFLKPFSSISSISAT